jgi:hypothetical protein
LGAIGAKAKPAVPALIDLLQEDDVYDSLHGASVSALKRIDPGIFARMKEWAATE